MIPEIPIYSISGVPSIRVSSVPSKLIRQLLRLSRETATCERLQSNPSWENPPRDQQPRIPTLHTHQQTEALPEPWTSRPRRCIWWIICLIDWLLDSLIDWLIDELIDWLIDWLMNWLIHCFIDWLIASLIDWLMNLLINCLIDWSIDWSIDWIVLKWFVD